MTYASKTDVSVERSRIQIERMINRVNGVDHFLYSTDQKNAVVMFRYRGRIIKWMVQLPDPKSDEIVYSDAGRKRSKESQERTLNQKSRSLWRSLFLIIKAKLEAIESGIVNFEDEFLPYTTLPDGSTVASWARPKIDKAIENKKMPQLQLT